MKINEILLSLLTGALETVGETKLEEVLAELKLKNPVQYEAAIQGGYALVTALTPLVAKTGTKIDDAIIASLKHAIDKSAADNLIALKA